VHFNENFTIAESKIHAYFFYFYFFSWETYPRLVSQVLNDKAWLFEMWITLSTGQKPMQWIAWFVLLTLIQWIALYMNQAFEQPGPGVLHASARLVN